MAADEYVPKKGDRVKVKMDANVKHRFRGRRGTVDSHTPGEVVLVTLDGQPEGEQMQCLPEDLEQNR